jgi:hypothetical protein
VFLSEGGRRKMARRLRAVADAKGVDLAGLPIRLSLRAPRIVNLLELAALEDEIETHRPGLIVLDPWYLSAPGVKMADLVRVGEVLAHLQDIAQAAGAALVITHHWNQTGQGTGAERLSGAGMAEWGRVLVSVNVASLQTSDGSSNAVLAVNVVGDEIAPRDVVVRRHVQVLGDPDDLTAPLTYTCQPSDVPVGLLGHSSARDRVLAVLSRQPDDWLDSLQIGDILAGWGIPLTAKSIRRAAAELVDDKAIDETEASRGRKQWSAQ